MKKTTPTAPPKGRAVATTGGGSSLPAALAKRASANAGAGLSTDQEDNLTPLLYVLQSGSPQVKKQKPEYIPGAEAGMLWPRGTQIVVPDLYFRCVHFEKDWVEWKPRSKGGGLQGRHRVRPNDAIQKEVKGDDGNVHLAWMRPNGNEVKETRYHIGEAFLEGPNEGPSMPLVIPFTSTGHSVSRGWMSMMNFKIMDNGNKAPIYMCYYHLSTKMRSNAQGDWFVIDVQDAGPKDKLGNPTTCWITTDEEFDRGEAMFTAFSSGTQKYERLNDEPADDGDM